MRHAQRHDTGAVDTVPHRRPAGKREEASVLGIASVAAIYLSDVSEAHFPGSGQMVTVLVMALIPFAAKVARDLLGRTLGEVARGRSGAAAVLLLILLFSGGCQTTHLDADGGLSVWSLGDVKVAACPGAEHAWEASELEAVTDVGVVAPDALPGCVVIHEGGLSEIAGNTLDALFDAALAIIGRASP